MPKKYYVFLCSLWSKALKICQLIWQVVHRKAMLENTSVLTQSCCLSLLSHISTASQDLGERQDCSKYREVKNFWAHQRLSGPVIRTFGWLLFCIVIKKVASQFLWSSERTGMAWALPLGWVAPMWAETIMHVWWSQFSFWCKQKQVHGLWFRKEELSQAITFKLSLFSLRERYTVVAEI